MARFCWYSCYITNSNNFYSNGIQGGIVSNALGMAFVEKYKKTIDHRKFKKIKTFKDLDNLITITIKN